MLFRSFSEVLRVPILLMGYGLPDDRLHSPNEKMSIAQFYDGIRCTVRLLDQVGELDQAGQLGQVGQLAQVGKPDRTAS